MDEFNILYATDFHGNKKNYKKFRDYSDVDAKIIGGDILPKNAPLEKFIETQRKYLADFLIPLFESEEKDTYILMGNDDAKCNMDLLIKAEKNKIFKLLHKKSYSLKDEVSICGYSNVSPTPFGIKDWEKWDVKNDEFRLYRSTGLKSNNNFNFENYEIDQNLTDTIESDLLKISKDSTIYVMHDPPYKTNLDQCFTQIGKGHVGSKAIRHFIEKNQPIVTLHGHIHESSLLSQSITDKIGKTICINPGSSEKELRAIKFNIYDIEKSLFFI